MPTDLIAFVRVLKGAHAGSLPGPEAGVPRAGARVLKVKQLVNKNKVSQLQGKRKHEQMRSGSRDFDRATKRVGIWQPTIQRGPIPESPREDPKLHFHWLSTVGEETMGEVTLCSPDNSSVTLKCRATRSYTRDYKCASCPNRHSVLAADTITVVLGDQHCPESMPPMADGSCALVVRLCNITIEELNFYVLGPINNFGGNWEN